MVFEKIGLRVILFTGMTCYAVDLFILSHLQMIDVIIAWLVAEDDGAKKKVEVLLAHRDETLETIKATLKGENVASLRNNELTTFRTT